MLAIVAAASRGDRITPSGGEGASAAVRDYFFSAYLVVGLVVFVVIVYLLAKERETLPTKRSKHATVRQLVQFGIIIAALFVVGPYLYKALRGDPDSEQANATQTARQGERERERSAERQQARFRWEPLIALGALGVVSVAVLVARRARRREEPGEADVADALASVLDEALADLRADRDPRRAVIAAYARMERLLAAHDVPRRPSEAPFEYLARVLLELQTSKAAVFELTALFERAKFSTHAIDEGMREEAIAALAAVRDELRGEP